MTTFSRLPLLMLILAGVALFIWLMGPFVFFMAHAFHFGINPGTKVKSSSGSHNISAIERPAPPWPLVLERAFPISQPEPTPEENGEKRTSTKVRFESLLTPENYDFLYQLAEREGRKMSNMADQILTRLRLKSEPRKA